MTSTEETQALLPVTPELLPCPKCESENVSFSGYGRGVYCIICKDCCIQTKFYQAKADVIADWNTRRISHSPPALERVVDWQAERGADDQILPAEAQESWIADAMRVLQRTTGGGRTLPENDKKTEDLCADPVAGVLENKAGGLWYRRWFKAQTRVNELEALLANPPKHKFWGPGEPDCPRDIKAANGELHTLRCRVCGLDNPRDDACTPPDANTVSTCDTLARRMGGRFALATLTPSALSGDAGEPVAYLHTLHMEGGQTYERLTMHNGLDPDDARVTAFGIPGRDYSEEYSVSTTPLYALPSHQGAE